MNYMIMDPQSVKTNSAVYLLNKYAKSNHDERTTVSFTEDISCFGDSYRIEAAQNGIRIYGNTAVAFNAAAGYLLRHQHTQISDQTVTFNSDFRSVYFANHFYNYYHSAPVAEVCEYLESLALWGQNTLGLWFDMHHFPSLSTPEANEMIEKMLVLFAKAKSLGMKTSLTHLANEYYKGAPTELLAENSIESGRYTSKPCGFYSTELCPSKQESEEKLLSSFRQLLSRFSSVGLDYIMLWPYDQGGCTCKDCYPWASNGFYKLAKKKAAIAKQYFPNAEIIFSCWMFDHFTTGEWATVLPLVKKDGDWIDKLMIDIGSYMPDELAALEKPIVSFPEISMYQATPWGGFGANPFPAKLKSWFQESKGLCSGGALYSEGIFEDINKVLALELLRDPEVDPETVILEYCAYHFGPAYAKEIADIVIRLENTLSRYTKLADGAINAYPSGKPLGLHTYVLDKAEDVEGIARAMKAVDGHLRETMKENWRYQLIYIRALGDLALVENRGVPNEQSDKLFSALTKFYHSEKAFYFVAPVTRESIMENRGNGIQAE